VSTTRLLLALALGGGCTAPAPASVAAEVACAPEATALRQHCRVRLTDQRTGRPVEGATVTLHADMPSMPLAHSVRPVTATSGGAAGVYEGTLELEMTGRWVIAVRIAGPVSDQLTHPIDVSP
jgi:hypothetical protein